MGEKTIKLSNLLVFFSDLYRKPDDGFCTYLTDPACKEELLALTGTFTGAHAELSLPVDPLRIQEMYTEAFVNTGKPYAPAIESYYKPWTTEEGVALPFANRTGYLSGDSAWHMEEVLTTLDIRSPDERMCMPDHLSEILMAAASLTAYDDLFCEFVSSHLDWLDAFTDQLERVGADRFYVQMTVILCDLIAAVNQPDSLKEANPC